MKLETIIAETLQTHLNRMNIIKVEGHYRPGFNEKRFRKYAKQVEQIKNAYPNLYERHKPIVEQYEAKVRYR